LEEFQSKLQKQIRDLTEREETHEREKIIWENNTREQQHRLENLEKKLEDQLKTLRDQNQDLVRTLSAKVEVLLGTIQDVKLRQELRKKYKDEVVPSIAELQELTPVPETTDQFQPGERVWVNLYKEFGEFVGMKKGQAELIIRNKKFTVPLNTLERKESVQQSLPKGIQVQFEDKLVEPELNLIGKTVDEALSTVDKYLDDAFLAQLPEVRIIHGHGTGRLKHALEEMLQSHPHVQRSHPDIQQRGGSGVTVVELKTR
jgi:DNA mismatch repair protein MutS2